MIKVETMPYMARKSLRAGEGYSYVQKWANDNQFKAHFKLHPSRNTMIIFDEISFEHFKKTFKREWKLIF
jgi:hypothetical protein